MKKQQRFYSRDFKLEALRRCETSGKSDTQIEHDLGISCGSMYRWKKAFAQEGEQAFPGHGRRTPEQERIRKLERENEILRQQRDILHVSWRPLPGKKAVAIFSHPKE